MAATKKPILIKDVVEELGTTEPVIRNHILKLGLEIKKIKNRRHFTRSNIVAIRRSIKAAIKTRR